MECSFFAVNLLTNGLPFVLLFVEKLFLLFIHLLLSEVKRQPVSEFLVG